MDAISPDRGSDHQTGEIRFTGVIALDGYVGRLDFERLGDTACTLEELSTLVLHDRISIDFV
jgi:hypothetical protein